MLAAVLLVLLQDRIVGEDPARAKWNEIMQYLRAGGGFDDPRRPEGMAFAKVKNMGEGAYPYLVSYIDNEDIMLCRAAVVVLNAMTGRNAPLPNEATKIQRKSEWEAWIARAAPSTFLTPALLALLECDTPEREVRAMIEALSHDDPAERRKAAVALRPCALRHEDLLRSCRAEARDAEIAARLDEVLAYLQSTQVTLFRIRSDPRILLEGVPPGSPSRPGERGWRNGSGPLPSPRRT